MPDTITKNNAKRKTEARPPARRQASAHDTGALNVDEIFPELKQRRPSPKGRAERKPDPVVKKTRTPVKGTPSVRVGTPAKGAPSVRVGTPAKGTPSVKVARKAEPAATPAPEGTDKEKPRLRLILGTAAVLCLAFICMSILNASFRISEIRLEDRMIAGDTVVRHETWEVGNSIADVYSDTPEVADVDIFLVQDEDDPGMVHFLIQAAREGQADIVIQYSNKDRKIITLTVEPTLSETAPRAANRDGKNETLDKAREFLRAGDELSRDADKAVENTYKAAAAYKRALRTMKQIRLHQFLPEYKGLEEKIQKAEEQVQERYKKAEAEYQVARDRGMHRKARELLKVMLQIVPDPKDPRNLINRTYLEYVHNQ